MSENLWLIAEYCDHEFLFVGWHLYLRESRAYQRRNKDGDWGWIRRPKESSAGELLAGIGCAIKSDGTMSNDGVAKFARQFPLKGRLVGGHVRGCLRVSKGEYGKLSIYRRPSANSGD